MIGTLFDVNNAPGGADSPPAASMEGTALL